MRIGSYHVEVDTYHVMLSASWRTRNTDAINQSESEGPKSRGASGVTPNPRAKT